MGSAGLAPEVVVRRNRVGHPWLRSVVVGVGGSTAQDEDAVGAKMGAPRGFRESSGYRFVLMLRTDFGISTKDVGWGKSPNWIATDPASRIPNTSLITVSCITYSTYVLAGKASRMAPAVGLGRRAFVVGQGCWLLHRT